MIGVVHKKFNQIPALEVVDVNDETKALPVIIYFHGFTSAKEHNLPFAYRVADQGYRVVLPDSAYHGEREIEMSAQKRQLAFWDIVIQNVKEIHELRKLLSQQELLLDDRIGVAGTSMGGITTSAALVQYPWVKAAAVLMGTPRITSYAKTLVHDLKQAGKLPITDAVIEKLYEKLERLDLSMQPEKLADRPLLFWHGEKDPVVPFDHSYSFYEDVKDSYSDLEKIQFVKESSRGHKVSRDAVLTAEEWFKTFL